jgi:hypothetical protein
MYSIGLFKKTKTSCLGFKIKFKLSSSQRLKYEMYMPRAIEEIPELPRHLQKLKAFPEMRLRKFHIFFLFLK